MSNNPHRLTPYAQQLRRDMTRKNGICGMIF